VERKTPSFSGLYRHASSAATDKIEEGMALKI